MARCSEQPTLVTTHMLTSSHSSRELGDKANETKRGWYEHNRVEDLSTLGSLILRNYRRFIGSLFPTVLDFDEKMELNNRIIAELSTRPNLAPYDR